MKCDHKLSVDGHQFVFDQFTDGEADNLIAWLEQHGYEAFAEPTFTMTWPSGKQYQVFRSRDGVAVFVRLFEVDPRDAVMLKLTFAGA